MMVSVSEGASPKKENKTFWWAVVSFIRFWYH